MKRATLILSLALLIGCKPKPAPKLFATAPGVPNPVNVVDGTGAGSNVLFTSGNPGVVTGGGGTITIDGGSVTANQGTAAAASGAWPVSIVNDAGNAVPVSAASLPLPTGAAQDTTLTGGTTKVQVTNDAGNPVPGDPTAGDLQNTVQHFVVATTAGVVASASGTFVGANFCNAGTLGGWLQFYAGQTTLDAGGTADAGTAPSFVTPYIPPLGCGTLQETQTFATGLTWYASSTQGLLTTDAGTPSITIDVVRR